MKAFDEASLCRGDFDETGLLSRSLAVRLAVFLYSVEVRWCFYGA